MAINFDKSISNTWLDIKYWFEKNKSSNHYTGSFKPPATVEEITKVENKIKLKFPQSLVDSYKTHNGVAYGIIAGGGSFLSLDELSLSWDQLYPMMNDYGYSESNYQFYLDEVASDSSINYDSRIKPFPFWHKWIPFMDTDGHTIYYIDLDPNAGGEIGQVIEVVDFDDWIVRANSFQEFLSNYQQDLTGGKYVIDSLGNLTEKSTIEETEKEIALNISIEENISTSLKLNEIESLNDGITFTLTGLITCENHFINEINEYRNSLKKISFFEKIKLRAKEKTAPKLSKNECFIFMNGDEHLILKVTKNNNLSKLTFENVVKAKISISKISALNIEYSLIDYEILK